MHPHPRLGFVILLRDQDPPKKQCFLRICNGDQHTGEGTHLLEDTKNEILLMLASLMLPFAHSSPPLTCTLAELEPAGCVGTSGPSSWGAVSWLDPCSISQGASSPLSLGTPSPSDAIDIGIRSPPRNTTESSGPPLARVMPNLNCRLKQHP